MSEVYLSFDLWNTLITPNPDYKRERTKYLSERFNEPERYVEEAHLYAKKVLDEVNSLGISLKSEYCWEMVEVYLRRKSVGNLYLPLQEIALNNPPLISSDLVSWFNDLSKTHNVSILSNTNMISGQTLRRILSSKGVDLTNVRTFFSDEVGVAIPPLLDK